MKLAPRIRRLESNAIRSLSSGLESLLQDIQMLQQQQEQQQQATTAESNNNTAAAPSTTSQPSDMDDDSLLLMRLGHLMRGLVLLGRGRDVESIFARVAVMPLIRWQVSMGRLDQGGARGACAGLPSLLQQVATSIRQTYGPVLYLAETTFGLENNHTDNDANTSNMDVDLLTAGVWVPIVTALMADAAIKMAVFSPGIASILQANYTALDAFCSQLATTMLSPSQPQQDHPN